MIGEETMIAVGATMTIVAIGAGESIAIGALRARNGTADETGDAPTTNPQTKTAIPLTRA